MDVSRRIDEGIMMEGWLYLIRSNFFVFKYSRKLYYVLQHRHFNSFKSISHSYNKDPIRSAVVDSSIHVMDNGRNCIRGKVFFVFTLYDTSNHDAHVKLGANSPEEAARWIKSFQELSQEVNQNSGNFLHCLGSTYSGRVCNKIGLDDILSLASITDPRTADIYEPSYWMIFGCHNGLRLFKQARDQEGLDKRDGHPALAAASVMEGTPEVIFQTLMSLGSSRSQWDFCFQKGSVIENIDGHTDIIHKQLDGDWLPWSMKRRDLLLLRYWRREDNGTYIILYHSVLHNKCPPQKGFIRAFVECGGYVISPVNQYKQSVVRHMLAIDWKFWRSYLQKSSARCLTIRMLGRLAALRELFKTNLANHLLSEFSSQELKKDSMLHQTYKEYMEGGLVHISSNPSNLVQIDDQSDEFFDFAEPLFDDESEGCWGADNGPQLYSQDTCNVKPCTSFANVIAEKKHEFVCELTLDTRSLYASMQRKGCADLEKLVWDECVSCNYTITLPEDQTGNLANSWSASEPSLFQLRGETFLEDRKKITSESTLLQTVAVDWLKSDKREDDLASRPGNIVQKYAADGRPEFFFIVNFQVPGSTTYNLVSYHMTSTPIKDIPLLERFIEGDDAFRNSRFKLIPHVSKGPWILRHTIHRPTLVGHMLKINYIRGKNYLEMDVDVGSSAFARGLASKTFSCFTSLIIEIAFVLQANTGEELPEHLFGAFRLNYLDISKACWANP
ncbi:protein ENHANCED DISEASE RESISTANCE 2-like [Cynara cardunculus var. scolymus]|uniref:protein ENHANCED DISEASE RESISTANCE 2-like n=1 Tax=Cynara cardunculus var. scolymus TaxID=59895 RepID=UPI000D62C86E|nr:protein ENHANCED DISEASE RESISTANCE 2-like [Cynara cardunculus var. scolymus]